MLCESSGYVRNTLLCIVENPTQFQALAMPKVLSWSWRKEGLTRVIHFMLTTSTPAFLWPDSCCPEESISVEPWSVTGDSLQTLSPKQNYVLVMVNHYFWELWLLIIWMVVLKIFIFWAILSECFISWLSMCYSSCCSTSCFICQKSVIWWSYMRCLSGI